jgi:hypothetical protein
LRTPSVAGDHDIIHPELVADPGLPYVEILQDQYL